MAITLQKANFKLVIDTLQIAAGDLGTGKDELNYSKSFNFLAGEGANQAELMYSAILTIVGGGETDIDLAGVLVSLLGQGVAFSFKAIKAIILLHKTTTATAAVTLSVGANGLASLFSSADTLENDTPGLNIRPGGGVAVFAPDATGYGVTAETGDKLHLVNNDADSVNLHVFLLGTV